MNGDPWNRLMALWSQWLNSECFSFLGIKVTVVKLLGFAWALALTWLLLRLMRRYFMRLMHGLPSVHPAQAYLLQRVLYYITLVIGVLIALAILGVNFTKLAVIGGALGVGIGFGLQSIVNNFLSGLILLFDRSLKLDDYVELDGGIRGVVREIAMRYTRINTNDNIDILVPNSEFIQRRVVNYTYNEPTRRLRLPFTVAYGTDKEKVRAAGKQAATAVSHTVADILAREPQVWLVEFAEHGLKFELVVWLRESASRSHDTVRAEYYWALETALTQHHIALPFPQRDLHVRSIAPEVMSALK